MTGSLQPGTIAIIGGTGKEGGGLAQRWARAGYRVIIGSRSAERAVKFSRELGTQSAAAERVSGASNLEAASLAPVVMLTVPYAAHEDTLRAIKPVMRGKLLIDATVPLQPKRVTVVQFPPAGSAAQQARDILGPETEVAAAFHTIMFDLLAGDLPIDCDVLVTGTTTEARDTTLKLVEAAGLRGWDAGALENSAVSEGLTSILIHINRQYRARHAGIRITGVNRE